MIESWDMATIRQEVKKGGPLLGGSEIIGMRVIVNKGKLRLECFSFNEFFELKKDH